MPIPERSSGLPASSSSSGLSHISILALTEKILSSFTNGIIQSFHKSSFYSGIVVQQDHIGASCLPDSEIHRMTESRCSPAGRSDAPAAHPSSAGASLLRHHSLVQIFHAPVSRTIVYDQHFIFRCIFLSLTQGSHAFR